MSRTMFKFFFGVYIIDSLPIVVNNIKADFFLLKSLKGFLILFFWDIIKIYLIIGIVSRPQDESSGMRE